MQETQILLCPDCKNHIPLISFIEIENEIKLIIKCVKCNQVNFMTIEEYKQFLFNKEAVYHKCSKDSTKCNNYCCDCQVWFCKSCLNNHNAFNQPHIVIQTDIDIDVQEIKKRKKEIKKALSTNTPITYLNNSNCNNKNQFEQIKTMNCTNFLFNINIILEKNNKVSHEIIESLETEIQILLKIKQQVEDAYKKNLEINHQIVFMLKCFEANYSLFKKFSTEEIILNLMDINFKKTKFNDRVHPDLKERCDVFVKHMIKDYIIKIKRFNCKLTKNTTRYNNIRCFIGLQSENEHNYALGLEEGKIVLCYPHLNKEIDAHKGSVLALLQLKNNKICSGSLDRTIKIWDDQTYANTLSFNGHVDSIYTIIERENCIVSGSKDAMIIEWKIYDNQTKKSYLGHTDCVRVLLKLHDGRVVSGSWDKTIILWDVNWENKIVFEGHSSYIYCLTQISNSKLASGSNDGEIIIWDIINHSSIGRIEGLAGGVHSLYYLKEKNILISGGYKELILWNISKMTKIASKNNHLSSIKSIAITTGKTNKIMTCCLKGNIFKWKL